MRILTFTILLLASAAAYASWETESPIFNYDRPSNEDVLKTPCDLSIYPDADTVIMFLHEGAQYLTNGAYVAVSEEISKVLTEPGKRDSLVYSISYNAAYGTSYFTRVSILKPNGMEIEIDVNTSETMIDTSQMSSNIYDPASKIVKINLPGLEVGDIYRVESIEICRKARMRDTWSGGFVGEFMSPLMRETVEVYAPKEKPLSYITKRFEIEGTITENKEEVGDLIHYSWEVKNVPQIFPEPSMAPFYVACQRYYFGTIPNWEEISKWYIDLCEPRMAVTTPEMEEKVKELIEGKTNIKDKAEAIFRWVAKKVRYSGLTTETVAPGYEPHDVKITFENRYGVCRDKAALLCAMHRMAGLEAYPVLILVGPKKDQDSPNPWFNHAINAVVDEKGEYIIMDPTPETEKNFIPPYEADTSYLICRPEGETLMTMPQEPVEDNMATEILKGRFDKEGNLLAELKATYYGVNDTNVRGSYLRAKDEDKKRMVENLLGAIFGASELFDYEITPKDLHDMSEPFSLSARFKATGLLMDNNGSYVMDSLYSMAAYSTVCPIILSRMNTSLDKRRFPMKLVPPCGADCYCELDMSALDLKDFSLPEFPVFDTPEIYYKQTLAITNGIFYSHRRQELRKNEIPAESYQTLKDYKKESQNFAYKRVFAKGDSNPYKDHHVVIISDDYTYEVLDDSTVKTTSKVTKKILDYAGKKANSELHFYYCDQNSTISLTNMYVELEDGTVRKVVDSEINVMDSDWKASAPRYPDIKHVVVTLPGTEIGSTVHYEVETVTKELPLLSGIMYQDPSEPTLYRRFAVIVPEEKRVHSLSNNIIYFLNAKTDVKGFSIYNQEGGKVKYEVELFDQTNIVKKESYLVPFAFRSPMLSYICLGKDEKLSGNVWKGYTDKLKKEVERATTDQKAVEEKVAELIKDKETLRQKVMAIRDFIEINIRGNGPSFESLPLSAISDADTVLKDGYANDFDTAVLYMAMLKNLGVSPNLLLGSGQDILEYTANQLFNIPCRGVFNDALVEISLNGQTIYLNCGSQYDMLETQGPDHAAVLDVSTGSISIRDIPSEFDYNRDTVFDITVNDDLTALISRKSNFGGTAYGSLVRDVCETLPEQLRREELAVADGIARGAQIIEGFKRMTNGYPGFTTIKVKADNYVQRDGETIYLKPFYHFSLGMNKPNRIYTYYSSTRSDNKTVIRITFPKEYTEAVFMPEGNYDFSDSMGYFVCHTEHEEGSSTWTIEYTYSLKPAVLDQEQYHKLHLIDKRLESESFNIIAVKKPDSTKEEQPQE
ncbi:DUF3857 domain-containing protein [bacterium]|nr:DUF3857 domain-containing protein [bacterium]